MTDKADLSGADLRRALRALPPTRRRALVRAVREGRAVDDPRDAALAVAWARRAQAAQWPKWTLPRTRPRGRAAVLWVMHATWLVVVVVIAVVVPTWQTGGIVRWVVVGGLVYSIVGVPWALALVLRTRWNAPEAERRNRPPSCSHPPPNADAPLVNVQRVKCSQATYTLAHVRSA